MNIKSILSATAVLTMTILPTTAVQAAEWHQDPGSACHAYYGNQQKYVSTLSNATRVNTNMWVSCPITSHGNAGGSGNKVHAYASLYKATSSPTACRFVTYTHSGSSGTWHPMSVQSGTGYKVVSKFHVTPATWGSASVICYLRTGDRIGSILSYN